MWEGALIKPLKTTRAKIIVASLVAAPSAFTHTHLSRHHLWICAAKTLLKYPGAPPHPSSPCAASVLSAECGYEHKASLPLAPNRRFIVWAQISTYSTSSNKELRLIKKANLEPLPLMWTGEDLIKSMHIHARSPEAVGLESGRPPHHHSASLL